MKPLFTKKTDRIVVNGKMEPDGMKFFIDVERISEEPVTRQDIIEVLKEFAKVEMIDLDVINDIVRHLNDPEAKEKAVKDRRVAKGRPAETGSDGKLLLLVKALTGEVELEQTVEGGPQEAVVNYRDIHLFDNLEAGRVVARVYEPKMGADGYDALGKVIPGKKGNPYKLQIDKTLSSRMAQVAGGEFTEVVAGADGYLMIESGRLTIQSELVIKGNLDYHAGNLDFIGMVKVLGDVMPDFRIVTKKGIEIRGMVRGENVLVARSGDVNIAGYVYGGLESSIIAAGDLYAAVVQEINAEIGGDAHIKKECVDSILRIGGSLLMPEGTLMGGTTHVVKGVQAKRIGNEAGQHTVIHLCSAAEATMEYDRIVTGLEDHARAISLLKSHLGPLVKTPERIQYLKEPLRSKMMAFVTKLRELVQSRESLVLKQQELIHKISGDLDMRINFSKKLFPGVILCAGKVRHEVKDEKNGPGCLVFDREKEEFVEAEYHELTGHASAGKDKGQKGK